MELTGAQQQALLAEDEILRTSGRCEAMSAVEDNVTTVTAWDGEPSIAAGSFARSSVPLAGFTIIEAADRDEAIQWIHKTPCARARGAIEIWPLVQSGT